MNYTAKQLEALDEVAARLKLEDRHKADALLAEFRRLCRKGIFRRNEFALVASFASPYVGWRDRRALKRIIKIRHKKSQILGLLWLS